jgi:hypothetical protein
MVPVPADKVKFRVETSVFRVPVNKIAPAPAPVERVTLSVLFRITFPVRVILLFTVVILAPIEMAPVRATAPVVEIGPVCATVLPVTFNELNGTTPPIAPDKVTAPEPERVNASPLFTVPAREIVEPVAITGPVKLIGPVKLMGLLVVVRLPPKLIDVDAV